MGRAPGCAGVRAGAVALACLLAATAAAADTRARAGGATAGKPPAAPAGKTPPAPTALDVVVTDAAGKPVEGAFVMALPSVGAYRWGQLVADRLRASVTDRDGRAKLETLAPPPWSVEVHARGYVTRSLPRVAAAALPVRLERGGTLTGTVRAADGGRPIAGARVRLGDEPPLPQSWQQEAIRVESLTDERGRFRLDGIGRSPVRLVARAAGYGAAQRGDVRAGEAVELFLFPGATLSGTVRDDAGRPVAGAAVRADSDRARWQAETTDGQGAFVMAGIQPGEYLVVARGGSRAPGIAAVVVEPEAEASVSLVLSEGGYATGQVVDADGRPLAGRVRLETFEGRVLAAAIADAVSTQAGADGRFALGPLPLGALGLGVSEPRHVSRRVDVTVPGRGRTVDTGTITLESGLAIRGTVHDAGGNPVPGCRVVAQSRSHSQRALAEAVTEADGTFQIGGQPAALYEVTAMAAGFAPARAQADAGGPPLALVLQSGAELTGRVADAQGNTVDDAEVEAGLSEERPVGGPGGFARSDEGGGRFTLRDLGAGSYLLQVRAHARGEVTLPGVRVAAGRTTDVGVVTLVGGGVVAGVVVDADGSGVPGAAVHLEKDLDMQLGQLETQTASGGGFELRGVPPGRINVMVDHPAFATPKPVVADVDPEKDPTPLRIVLTRGARLEGRAQRRDGTPFAGARVRVSSVDVSGGSEPAPVAADGTFVVDHLPPGRATVRLTAVMPQDPSGAGPRTVMLGVATQEVDLREAETSNVSFLLRDVVVSGRVTRGGQPLPGVSVTLTGGEGGMSAWYGPGAGGQASAGGPLPLVATTRDDGGFELVVFSPGRYRVSLRALGSSQAYAGRFLEVPDVERYEAELEVGATQVGGIVVDRENGQPLSRVVVEGTSTGAGGPPRRAMGETGADGRFTLSVDPGEVRLEATAEKYKPASAVLNVGADGLSDVRLDMERGLAITGRVVDEAGRPQGDVAIQGVDAAGHALVTSMTYSLADGSFRIDGLEPGSYTLCGGSGSRGYGMRAGVTAGDSATVPLRPPARVAVLVTGPDGGPVKGAALAVRTWDGVPVELMLLDTPSTDAAGRAESSLPAGRIEVVAGAGRMSGSAVVNAAAGEAVAIEIRVREPVRP